MTLGLIDVGGTSIKFGVWQDGQVTATRAVPTPADWPAFTACLQQEVILMQKKFGITGVGISSAGMVDVETGTITGAGAAEYAHERPLRTELAALFGLPVSIENDANCAALGEATYGAAAGIADVCVLVVGTGVGGAVVLDGRVRHGVHRLAGEFGYMLTDAGHTVSRTGTAVNMATAYNAAHPGGQPVTGRDLFAAAAAGDAESRGLLESMAAVLARTIFNLQYSLDPACFVIGGGVSANPAFLPMIETALDQVMATVAIAPIRPQLRVAQFRNDANLVGAAVNFMQQHN